MGASGWEYVVPYQADLQAALNDLRRQVFAAGDYIGPEIMGLPVPDSLEGLEQEPYWEFMGTHGTHSVIDVTRVVYDEGEQDFATVFPLTDDEAPTARRCLYGRAASTAFHRNCLSPESEAGSGEFLCTSRAV